MTPFDYAMQGSLAALAIILARMFMFDPRRCPYCGARTASAHHESCPSNRRLG